MNIERVKHNGHIVISDIVDGYLFKRTYIGYSMKEAKKRFKDESKIGFLDH